MKLRGDEDRSPEPRWKKHESGCSEGAAVEEVSVLQPELVAKWLQDYRQQPVAVIEALYSFGASEKCSLLPLMQSFARHGTSIELVVHWMREQEGWHPSNPCQCQLVVSM